MSRGPDVDEAFRVWNVDKFTPGQTGMCKFTDDSDGILRTAA